MINPKYDSFQLCPLGFLFFNSKWREEGTINASMLKAGDFSDFLQ